MKRILVTGGTGFVGRPTVAALLKAGHTVRIFDLNPREQSMPHGVEIVTGDVTDAAAVTMAAEGCGGIVHLAGLMTVDCARNPLLGAQVNLIGGINVFEAAAKYRVPVAWLSTAGVFGPHDAVNPRPMTIYGTTKLAVEGVARTFAADHGVSSLGLRPYIVYGPGESSGIAAGPSIAITASLARREATIRFSGRVGFVYVVDVAKLLAAAVDAPPDGAEMLTMAGDTRDMADFVRELAHQTGWNGIGVDGLPLRIPADLASDPVPHFLGRHGVTGMADGIARSLTALREGSVAE